MKQNTLGYVIAFVVLIAIALAGMRSQDSSSAIASTTIVQDGHKIGIDLPDGMNQSDITFSIGVYGPNRDYTDYQTLRFWVLNNRYGTGWSDKTNDGHDYTIWYNSESFNGGYGFTTYVSYLDEGTFYIILTPENLPEDQPLTEFDAMTKSVKVLN